MCGTNQIEAKGTLMLKHAKFSAATLVFAAVLPPCSAWASESANSNLDRVIASESRAAFDPTEAMSRILAADAQPTLIAEGHRFTEGPVWVPAGVSGEQGFLLYSDIPNNTIHRLNVGEPGATAPFKPEVWLKPSGHANGLALDSQNNVLIAVHDGRVSIRPASAKLDEPAEVLVDKDDGKGLNSPNDLVVAADGSIFFTDPPYGLRPPLGAEGRKRELDYCGVYRISPAPERKLSLVTKDFEAPNGIALSPDGRTLYVANYGVGAIHALAIESDGTFGAPRLISTNVVEGAEAASSRRTYADGIRVDVEGNIYSAGPGGVWVCSATGVHLGVISLPKSPTNLCFGGDDYKTLFATTRDSVMSISVKIAGLPPASRTLPTPAAMKESEK